MTEMAVDQICNCRFKKAKFDTQLIDDLRQHTVRNISLILMFYFKCKFAFCQFYQGRHTKEYKPLIECSSKYLIDLQAAIHFPLCRC